MHTCLFPPKKPHDRYGELSDTRKLEHVADDHVLIGKQGCLTAGRRLIKRVLHGVVFRVLFKGGGILKHNYCSVHVPCNFSFSHLIALQDVSLLSFTTATFFVWQTLTAHSSGAKKPKKNILRESLVCCS